MEACRAAARQALAASNPDEVTRVLREAVAPHLDLRLIDPTGPLPGRGSGGYST